MRPHSLRLRLIVGGFVAILAALTVAGGGLVVLFERHVARSLADDLDLHLKQLLAAIDVDAEGRLVLAQEPADPRFAEPLSGLYWQVSEDGRPRLRSRSLWDTVLTLPSDELATNQIHQHAIAGPGGTRILVTERAVNLTVGDRRAALSVAVGADLTRVTNASAAFARELGIALSLLGGVLAVATSIQVGLGLRPLDALRRGIAEIRAGRSRRMPDVVPSEVRPLVDEVNALVAAQDGEIERSRRRAADLAHGLKTPLAALAADIRRLHERGEHAIAQDLEALGEAMSRHVDREMVRARVRGRMHHSPGAGCEVNPLVRSLIGTLARTPAGAVLSFDAKVGDVYLPFDRDDLAEVLGNLLENAARHARHRVRISAETGANGPRVTIEDDGPGIAPAEIPRMLERGARLDERGTGAGLGLAIVQDVLGAYAWDLDLDASELGGLKVSIAPKAVL